VRISISMMDGAVGPVMSAVSVGGIAMVDASAWKAMDKPTFHQSHGPLSSDA
jgi:hypothetical protein